MNWTKNKEAVEVELLSTQIKLAVLIHLKKEEEIASKLRSQIKQALNIVKITDDVRPSPPEK